jgi:DNA-binding transcriptional ArsR family regulator
MTKKNSEPKKPPLRFPESKLERGSPVYHNEFLKVLMREWSPYMTHAAYSLLLMIFDRTVGWRKQWERITLMHFEKGVGDRDGNMYHGGTGMSRRTIQRHLRLLIESGAILKREDNEYSINIKWEPRLITVP